MNVERRNWAENLAYTASAIHHPASVEDVQELVAGSRRVKALGTRHSFTAVADTPGIQISLARLAPDISVDSSAGTVSVSAGTSYGVLAAELNSLGHALENMGSLPQISVGGATATGTHGSGDTNGILSTAIAAIELVTADGSLRRVDRSDRDLAGLAVGLGAFGVITRLELDVQPAYLMRQDVYRDASWDLVLDSLDEVMASAYSVSLLGDVSGPTIRSLWLKRRVDDSTGNLVIPDSLHGGVWSDDTDLRADHSLNPRAGVVGPWSERLPHFRMDGEPSVGGDELQTEYFVDRAHGPDALRAVRALGHRISPHLHGAEIRTVASDRLWLSPAYDRPSLCIGFTWRKHPAEVMALLPAIETALAPFAPRPHWGKLFTIDHLDDRFPRLVDFLDLAAAYDPDRTFWSPFLERLSPPGR